MKDAERRFVEGKGRFVEDLTPPGTLHLRVVRSLYARATLVRVRGGITHEDLPATLTSVGEDAAGDPKGVPFPVLASKAVQFVGQPVAAVLGRDRYQAEDLAASVEVEYEPLPAVTDPEAAVRAPPIHEGTASNVFHREALGAPFSVDAPVVIRETFVNERVVPNPMEPRGVLAAFDGGRLTVWASTQSTHAWRQGLSRSLGLPLDAVRVVGVDTGGAFGSKGGIYPEYVVAAYAAMKRREPVKWVETRSEHLVATNQGRGARATMTVHADRTGLVEGLEADVLVDGGAYPLGGGTFTPGWIGYQITGPYAIRRASVEARSVFTNKVPLGPYRGAGRPEAAFFIERILDRLADEIGADPVDVRLRNASAEPFESPLELTVPPLRPFLEAAVRELGYRAKVARGNAGFAAFILIPGTSGGESARIAARDGRLHVWLGGHVHGQGHDVFARTLVHEALGVPPASVDVETGDTDALGDGVGTWGSRSAMVGGAAILKAAAALREAVAARAGGYSPDALLAGAYDATAFHDEEGDLNSLGANLVTVDVDPTGAVRIGECASYYDVGRVLHPAMVDGQIVGGAVQAIGQVLYEEVRFNEDGQPLVASLADAGLPTAAETAARFVVKLAHGPSPLPHGAKGVGESPTIGVPPALVRALEVRLGRRFARTPLRPEDLARPPPRRA